MITFIAILYVLLGWMIGLAINHAADILPKREPLFQWPRCAVCQTFRPYQTWSAWVAYLSGHQQCHHCGQRRAQLSRSMIIECIVPVFFVFLWWYYGFSLRLAIFSLYTAILILITVTDLEHRLILNGVMLPTILFALAAAFFTPGLRWPIALFGGTLGFISSYTVLLISRGGFGAGDVTLSTFLGLILGYPHIVLSLCFGVFLGGFVSFLLLITRRVGLKTFIPYGPFLTITGWLMLIWGADIWRFYFQ